MAHLISAVSITFISLNLVFWLIPLTCVAVLKLVIPVPAWQRVCFFFVDLIYRCAVAVDRWWLRNVLGITMSVDGERPARTGTGSLIVSNHRSWFDILVLQSLLVPDGDILNFLIKQELIYVPIVGWLCLAMGFPRLYRNRDHRAEDSETVRRTALNLKDAPAGVLIFAEGTRFNDEKRARQDSPYRYLLRPRAGGISTLLTAVTPETPVYDLTLVYDQPTLNFWQCISGAARRVTVRSERFSAREVSTVGAADWLNARWRIKDQVLAEHHSPEGVT